MNVLELVNDLKNKFGKEKLTVKTDMNAKVNFADSSITFNKKTYSFSSVGKAAQELIVDGGLEEWVKKKYLKTY